MNKIYRAFYLDGRESILDNEVELAEFDLDPTIEKCLAGASVHETTHAIARQVLKPIENEKAFVKDNAAQIAAAGGDGVLAYAQYREGQVDQLRAAIEEQVIDAMHEDIDAGGDEEDEDDEEDEEDEDDDDDEDGDEEDEDGEEDDDDA